MSGVSEATHAKSQQTPEWGILGSLFGTTLIFLAPRFTLEPFAPWLLNMLAIGRNNKLAIYSIALQALTIFLVTVFVKVYRRPLSDIGVRWPGLSNLALAVPGFGVYYVLTVAANYIVGFFYTIDYQQAQDLGFARLSSGELALAFIALVILVPLAEELLFRGLLFTGFRRRLPFFATALIVSILFGWVHGQWNVALDTFALSLVLCYLREETGSIWPAVLLHTIKNGVAFTIRYIL